MSKMSFLDKFNILIDLSKTSKYYLIVLIVLLIFGIIISFTSRKNQERNRTIYFIMTVAIATLLVVTYHSSLGNMFTYMMNNFFIVVYFPNIAIYLAAIIAMNIIVWISIFSFKSSTPIRLLNVSIYIIMNYLLALLLSVVNDNKLDIFNQVSLYSNKQATALIELSSIIFVVWIVFLVLYKLILIYLKRDYKPKVNKVIVNKIEKELPDNFIPQEIPELVYGKTSHKEKVNALPVNFTKEQIPELIYGKVNHKEKINLLPKNFSPQKTPEFVYGKAPNNKPIIIKEENYDNKFTLDEYKLFSKILKEYQKNKTDNIVQEAIATIKQPVVMNLDSEIVKEDISLQEKEEEKEQKKLTELEMLYQKVI